MRTRLFTINIQAALLLIASEMPLVIDGVRIDSTDARVRTFLKGTKCTACGREGVFFAIEREPDGPPHFYLYAVEDGQEILMNSDHIFPKSEGGKGALKNRQPMCQPCNLLKGAKLPD